VVNRVYPPVRIRAPRFGGGGGLEIDHTTKEINNSNQPQKQSGQRLNRSYDVTLFKKTKK